MLNKSAKLNNFLLLFIFTMLPVLLTAQQDCTCKDTSKMNNLKTVPGKLAGAGCRAYYYELTGERFIKQRNYDSADYYLQLAIKEYSNNNCSNLSYLNVYKLLAAANNTIGDYEKSIQYHYHPYR